ncbi:PPOX class F420-dependent oxidoreductase [uncultured Jatrophihabitans sp.]|uniref:PPOX class F420-dependent oxidoreductase n=1 Tax=uncultured Jatrophihabitans sp. TaxID=1610747 RepID=UPI0035CC3231
MSDLAELAAEPFVSLATFRRSGERIATPLWVVGDGAGLRFWTPRGSGKVKRVRHNQHVELRPCDRRGRVAPDAPTVTGQADIVDDPATMRAVADALRAKYGWQYRFVTVLEKLRPAMTDRVVVAVRPDSA